MTQLLLRHPRDEALLHGFVDELWAGFVKRSFVSRVAKPELRDQSRAESRSEADPAITLVTQLPLRHPRDEALLHGFADELLTGFVKRSFVSRVAKRELRDQGEGTRAESRFGDVPWFTLVTQLPLRHPRDEAPLHGYAGELLAGFVKRSFVSRVAKRELRDQGPGQPRITNHWPLNTISPFSRYP